MSKKNNKKDWLSIDNDDSDNDYLNFSQFWEEQTRRRKNYQANLIVDLGEDLLKEINQKKEVQDQEKEILIKYIIKKSKNKKYSPEILRDYGINDVREIHTEIKHENRSWFKKMFEMF